jgi:hypothetical protein
MEDDYNASFCWVLFFSVRKKVVSGQWPVKPTESGEGFYWPLVPDSGPLIF